MAFRTQVLVLFALVAAVATTACGELVDAVVATVGQEVILHSDIMNEISPLVADLPPDSPDLREIYGKALDQAIDQKILYREGVLNGATLPDDYVDRRLEAVRKGYESEDAFQKAIQDAGETLSDFRERFKKQLLAWHVADDKRTQLQSQAVISEAELAQYYQDHIDEFQKPERVKLYRIFIAAENNPEARGKAVARLEALREELGLGADFSQLAKTHSEGPAKDQGGFVGWIGRDELIPALEEVAFALNPGDISPIIETEFGVMLLKVEEKVEAGLAPFEEVRTELEPALRNSQAEERYQKWMAELRKRSRVRKFD